MKTYIETEIREITVCNTIAGATPPILPAVIIEPALVIIYFFDGVTHWKLFQAILQPGETLSYNSTPGVNGNWSVFNAFGQQR